MDKQNEVNGTASEPIARYCVDDSFPQFRTVRYVELSQECIERIADAVVRKIKQEVDNG